MNPELTETLDRLTAATDLLQQAAARLTEREASFTIEAEADRIHELSTRLHAAEARLAELSASSTTGRKTLPAATATLLAKQGVTGDSIASMEAGAIDAALVSLSMEQRIAVKAQLLRSGLLG